MKSNYEPNFELKNIFYAGNTGRPQNLSAFLSCFVNLSGNGDIILFFKKALTNLLLNFSAEFIFINSSLILLPDPI